MRTFNSMSPLDAKRSLNSQMQAQLAKLAKRLHGFANLRLSERDLQFLLWLLAQGEILDPQLFAQLVALLLRTFNLRHIPLRMLPYEVMLMRRHRRRLRRRHRSTAAELFGSALELSKPLAARQCNLSVVPYEGNLDRYDSPQGSSQLEGALGSQGCSQVARFTSSRRLSEMSARNRRSRVRQLLLFSFYNAPLYNAFTAILLNMGRDTIRRFLATLGLGPDGRLSVNALEYFDQHGHGQLALKALCRKFAGQVRLALPPIVSPSLSSHESRILTHECSLFPCLYSRMLAFTSVSLSHI